MTFIPSHERSTGIRPNVLRSFTHITDNDQQQDTERNGKPSFSPEVATRLVVFIRRIINRSLRLRGPVQQETRRGASQLRHHLVNTGDEDLTPFRIFSCMPDPYNPAQYVIRAQAYKMISVGCFSDLFSKQTSFRFFQIAQQTAPKQKVQTG